MVYLRTALALGAGMALGGVWACGGSSTSASPSGDGGNADAGADVTVEDGGTEDAAVPEAATCNPTSADNACAAGMVCCFDPMTVLSGGLAGLTSGLKGGCTEPAACLSSVKVQCLTAAGCAANQVCCIAGGLGGGGDAGAAGGLGLAALTGFSAPTTCQSSCPAGQMQACNQTSDCTGSNAGLVCSPLGLGALAGPGGATAGLGISSILGGLATEMVCAPPDAGAGSSPDSGETDSGGLDAGPPDSGPSVDAGDAGAADGATSDGM
jgi:hypothetical protein